MKIKHSLILVISIIFFMFSCKTNNKLPDPLKAGWKGVSVCQLIKENKSIRVLKCSFPPNVGHERHYHKPHFGYTLAGSKFRIKDTTGVKEVQVLTENDFYSNGTEWHEVLNIGDSTAVFLIMEPKQ